jgi:hypothetical protein
VLRKQGGLDWDMVLDLTRELDQWQTYASPREARAALRRGYDEDRWLRQPYYPIFIVEKDTMEPVCRPMAMAWQMPFASSRGYSSLRLQYDVAKMLKERRARTGQRAIVYFISDLDPSGLDLQRAWEEALANFGAPVWKLIRIGLTRDQVEALDNPRLRQGIQAKSSDSRWQSYYDQYGEWSRQFTGESGYARDRRGVNKPIVRCWETDVLPESAIQEALDADIRSWLDAKLWERREREIKRACTLL